jgi:hypothetical protein
MKLPNCTKKRKTRATLYTFKIRSLIKREMRLKNNRLSKIGGHISTNKRIKLRENRRNIKLFTNKHKVITTFIHVSNDIKLCKGVLIYSITEQLGTRRKKKYSITEQLGTRRKKKYSITEQLGTRRKKKVFHSRAARNQKKKKVFRNRAAWNQKKKKVFHSRAAWNQKKKKVQQSDVYNMYLSQIC